MRRRIFVALCAVAGVLGSSRSRAADAAYLRSIGAFLHERFDGKKDCMVIGVVDEKQTTVMGAGSLDNGTGRPVDGNTVFFIGSVTKTFTALLLAEMAERGEVKLEDPVARYLPASVTVPAHGGKEIRLVDLATQASGFPMNASNMAGKDDRERYESYTVERMYAFVSGFELMRDPGEEFRYSNVGMSLLGNAEERATKKDFEKLLVERICQPLGMESTCIHPTEEMKGRMAMGHDEKGGAEGPWELQAYIPAGSVHSTANDLLKYAAAHAGITKNSLASAITRTHVIAHEDFRGDSEIPGFGSFGHTAMCWVDRDALQPAGMELLGHAGGAGSYHAWVGFDVKQHRGVVVLATENDVSVEGVGWTVLQERPLRNEAAGQFAHAQVGVGIAMDVDAKTGVVSVKSVIADSPVARAGVAAGMVIRKIDDVKIDGKKLAEVTQLLHGDAGTKVRLELADADGKVQAIQMVRGKFMILPA